MKWSTWGRSVVKVVSGSLVQPTVAAMRSPRDLPGAGGGGGEGFGAGEGGSLRMMQPKPNRTRTGQPATTPRLPGVLVQRQPQHCAGRCHIQHPGASHLDSSSPGLCRACSHMRGSPTVLPLGRRLGATRAPAASTRARSLGRLQGVRGSHGGWAGVRVVSTTGRGCAQGSSVGGRLRARGCEVAAWRVRGHGQQRWVRLLRGWVGGWVGGGWAAAPSPTWVGGQWSAAAPASPGHRRGGRTG